MNSKFNIDFYIAVATVNPIFFLALTLQGTFYNGLMENIHSVARDIVKAQEGKRNLPRELKWRSNLARVIAFLAVGILCAGLGGEVTAIVALYHQRASDLMQSFVFWSAIGVILLTAITPGWALVRAYRSFDAAINMELRKSAKFLRESLTFLDEAKRFNKEAKRFNKEAERFARRRRVLGADHPDTLGSANNLAEDLRRLGEYQAARELDEDTLAHRRRVLGDDHPDTRRSVRNLAADLHALGETDTS